MSLIVREPWNRHDLLRHLTMECLRDNKTRVIKDWASISYKFERCNERSDDDDDDEDDEMDG